MFSLHLKGVVDETLCADIIDKSHGAGFHSAKVNNYGKLETLSNVRNNERCEIIDDGLAGLLSGLIAKASGENFPGSIDNHLYSHLSNFFRVYRYTPGQFFKPHRDGDVEVGDSIGMVTVLLYLNETDGGETILMPKGYVYKDDWITVKPRTGDVLMFEHNFWHEGKPVNSGEKYVLRTDLFYKK